MPHSGKFSDTANSQATLSHQRHMEGRGGTGGGCRGLEGRVALCFAEFISFICPPVVGLKLGQIYFLIPQVDPRL